MALYRAYDPVLGRWISEDPIGESGGLNLYGYVENGPLGAVDPLGLIDWGPGTDSWKADLESTKFGKTAIAQIESLEASAKKAGKNLSCKVSITRTSDSKGAADGKIVLNPKNTDLYYNSNQGPIQFSQGQILVHEMGHIYQFFTKMEQNLHAQPLPGWDNACEKNATQVWENRFLQEKGKPDRIDHTGITRP